VFSVCSIVISIVCMSCCFGVINNNNNNSNNGSTAAMKRHNYVPATGTCTWRSTAMRSAYVPLVSLFVEESCVPAARPGACQLFLVPTRLSRGWSGTRVGCLTAYQSSCRRSSDPMSILYSRDQSWKFHTLEELQKHARL